MSGLLPRVSIAVLSHRKDLVTEAEASARGQTYPNVQVVTNYCELPWAEKLNDIVNATRGEFVTLLCDDDRLDPTWCARLMRFAHAGDVFYTDRIHFETGKPVSEGLVVRMHGNIPPCGADEAVHAVMQPSLFVFGSPLPMTIMVRRSFWNRLGGYDGKIHHADTEFFYRAVKAGARCIYVPDTLFHYRVHPGQLSQQRDTMTQALRDFHRKHFTEFGVAMHRARRLDAARLDIEVIRPVLRLGYKTAHFTSLTTMGHMPTRTVKLSNIAKTAVALQQKIAAEAVNQTIRVALSDSGLNPEDGWRLNDDLDAVLEAPDVPAVDPAVPQAPPGALVQ